MSIAGKVIVVTGASSGFGERIARRCVQRGARVVLVARTASALEYLAAELGPQRALAVPTDVQRDDDVQRLAAATYARFGHADALVNNAGFGVMDRVADARLADLEAMLNVNLVGAARCTQAFLPGMLARRSGQIVNVASQAGLIATQNMAFYSATKFALVALSRSLMLELNNTGVCCTLVCPGVAMTDFMQHADINKYSRATRLSTTTPDAVADAVVRAISHETHGEVLVPARGRVFAALVATFPGLSRRVMRVLR